MGHVISDIIFVLAGLLIVFLSARRGFFKNLMGFCKVFLAIGAAYLFGGRLAPWITKAFPVFGEGIPSVIAGYVAAFLLAFILLTIATWILSRLIKSIGLVRKIDILLGAVLGILIAMMGMFVAASIFKIIPGASELYEKTFLIRFFGNSSFLEIFGFLNVGNLLK